MVSRRRCHSRRSEIITGCGCWLIRPRFQRRALLALISVNNQRRSNPIFRARPLFLILRFPPKTPSDAQILPLPLRVRAENPLIRFICPRCDSSTHTAHLEPSLPPPAALWYSTPQKPTIFQRLLTLSCSSPCFMLFYFILSLPFFFYFLERWLQSPRSEVLLLEVGNYIITQGGKSAAVFALTGCLMRLPLVSFLNPLSLLHSSLLLLQLNPNPPL